MPLFVKAGNTYSVNPDDKIDARQKLPVGAYTVMFNMEQGFFLETTSRVEITHRIFGHANDLADRILTTWEDREVNTGVLLSGDKGSGKTVLAKLLSIKGFEHDAITIYVNNAYVGDSFMKLISTINQPAIIVLDEFEKVYPSDKQEALLTLFDGLFPSKKLFVVTVNETNRMSNYMLNRPGRFFYHISYKGLKKDEILEYVTARLDDKSKIDSIVKTTEAIPNISYDMLSAVCEEINRYGEDIKTVLQYLNIEFRPQSAHYKIESVLDKTTNEKVIFGKGRVYLSPSTNDLEFYVWDSEEDRLKEQKGDDYSGKYLNFSPGDIKEIKDGRFSYDNGEHKVVISKRGEPDFKELAISSLLSF